MCTKHVCYDKENILLGKYNLKLHCRRFQLTLFTVFNPHNILTLLFFGA